MQQTKKAEENKIKTRQQIKKGKSKSCCRRQSTWLIIAPLSHRYHSAVTLLSLRCSSIVARLSHRYHTAIVPLSRCCCRSVVALLSQRYCTAITPLSLRCCCSCCLYAVTPLLHRYRAAVAPLLSLLLLLRSRTAIATLSHRCLTAVAPAQREYKQIKIELLLLYYNSTIASAVDRKVHTVVISRGIIRVTVTIGDFQARVSSSSEGCLTLQKTVKV